MTVHSFSSAAGAAAPLTRARVSGSLPVWSLSLGCPKNRVDTEHLLGSLGMPVHSVEHMGRARLVFINTCGFIEPAVRESIRSILDAVERLGRCKRRPLLAVAGCMVGRYGVKDLAADLPEVDLWLPTDELENWPAMVREALGLPAAPAAPGRLLSTGPSYAWLKVGEGCRHKCAFCTIPSIRGPLRSVPAADLREEARGLLAGGVRELVLVAQDLTSWGSDFDTPQRLPHLLDELLPLDRLTWLRLLYLYPSGVTPELLRYMREAGPQLLPYFDIPLQHAHPEVLTRMGRPFANDPRRVVDRVREALPEAALRTTFIVGYPGETEEQYAELCDFVKTVKFDRLGCFAYSAEENTVAAKMDNQIDEEVKQRRADHIMELQAEISAEKEAEKVGKTYECICDGVDDETGMYLLRSAADCPEIDGSIMTPADTPLETGAFYNVTITDADTYDLYGYAESKVEE